MQAVASGYATLEGTAGADYWLKNYQRLPSNYITKKEALDSGWIPEKGNFDEILPGKAIGGSVYYNRNGHLLQKADVYGTKQILIIPVVSEALNEYCILAMD